MASAILASVASLDSGAVVGTSILWGSITVDGMSRKAEAGLLMQLVISLSPGREQRPGPPACLELDTGRSRQDL